MALTFTDLFSDKAAQYAAARPRYPDELFDWIASQSPARRLAWDCGTGNGQAALGLARHFAAVHATDPSAAQIANALPDARVRYAVEPAEASSLSSGSVDAICVAQALHWFDFPRYFAEVRRVAAPDALFAAWGYDWFSVGADFDAAFSATVLNVIRPYWAAQNQLLWDGYAGVPVPFDRLPAPPFAISLRWNFAELMAYVGTWSAVRRCLADRGPAFMEAALARLVPLWGASHARQVLLMKLHVVAARVRDGAG